MADGSVLVTEIVGRTVKRCFGDGRIELVARLDGGPNGAALGPDGMLYVCNNGGMAFSEVPSRNWILPGEQPSDYRGGCIQRVDVETGEVRVLYTECGGHPLRGPNDIVFDASGGFWFTDHGKARERDRDRGGVFYARTDGGFIRQAIWPLDAPNGIGLSADGSQLYVAESFTARLWTWQVTGAGEVKLDSRRPALGGKLMIGLGGYHLFDSLAVDPEGNVCVATLGDRTGITVVLPEGGTSRHITLPGPMPTNLCFDGEQGSQAFATLSPQGELVSWPWSSTVSPEWETGA